MNKCPTCSSYNYSDLSICSSCGGWIGQKMWEKSLAEKTANFIHNYSMTPERFSAAVLNLSPISLDIQPNPAYIAVPQNGTDPVKSRIAELSAVLHRTQRYIAAAEYWFDRTQFARLRACVAAGQHALAPYVTH